MGMRAEDFKIEFQQVTNLLSGDMRNASVSQERGPSALPPPERHTFDPPPRVGNPSSTDFLS